VTESPLKASLAAARTALAAGDPAGALAILRDCVTPESDFVTQARVAKRAAEISLPGLRRLRIAVLAGSTVIISPIS